MASHVRYSWGGLAAASHKAEFLTRAAAKPRLPGPPQVRALSYPHAKRGFPLPSTPPSPDRRPDTTPPFHAPRGSFPPGPLPSLKWPAHCPSTSAPGCLAPTPSLRGRLGCRCAPPGDAGSNGEPDSTPSSGPRRPAVPSPDRRVKTGTPRRASARSLSYAARWA